MLTLKRKKFLINIRFLCFYVFWFTLLIGKGWGYSSVDSRFVKTLFCTIPLIFLKLILTNWTRTEFLRCVLINLLGIIVWRCSGSADILLTTVAITACKDIKLQTVFRLTVWIKGGLFVLRTTLAMFGIIENTTQSRMDLGLRTLRYGLGYGNPNIAHYTFMTVIMLLLLVYHNKMRLMHYILLYIYNLLIFSYTDSRTAVYITTLCIAVIYVMDKKRLEFFRKIMCFIGQYVFIIGMLLSFAIVILYDKIAFLQSLNTMSARFSTGYSTVLDNNLSLFGVPKLNSDLGYITTLYGSGIIVFVLFIFGMTALMIELKKRRRYVEILFFAIFSGYHIMANYNDSISMNPMLLYLVIVMFPKSADGALG